MTYCVGLLLEAGLVMIADTRTNAGVDNFSSYRKLHPLARGEDREIWLCTSGSLSMTQSLVSLLTEEAAEEDGGRSLVQVPSMFRAAQLVGETVRTVNRSVGAALAEANIQSSLSLLLGGRVGDEAPSLYLVYSAGNFIECAPESPFLQIGETKYGKPILDRGLRFDTPLPEAVKLAFLSFDGAMRSNLGVARPLDMMVMPSERGRPLQTRRIEADDSYFDALSLRWAELIEDAARSIPNPPFLDP
jgi:putative proteasome-type protease